MAEVQGAWLSSSMGIFFGWASLACLFRAWAKLRTKAWGLDDYAISGSAGLYLGQLFYILSFGLCRASAALFIAYVSQCDPHIVPAQVVAVVTAVWTVASTLAICIRGDVSQPWAVFDERNMFTRWIAVEVTGILIELALLGVAAHLVWGVRLKLSKRIVVLCAFGARLLVVPLIIARLVFLDPRINAGLARGATTADLLTEACVHFSIITGCATALKPLLTSFDSPYPAAVERALSPPGSYFKGRADGNGPYYHLEALKPAALNENNNRQTNKAVFINHAAVSDITWQAPQRSLHKAWAYSRSSNTNSAPRSVASSWTDNGSSNRKGDTLAGRLNGVRMGSAVSSGSDDSGRMIIQKTT